MQEEVFRMENICFNQLLFNINMSLFKQEMLCVFVRNKIQKDTLFNILKGHLSPTKGNVYLNEKKFDTLTPNLLSAYNVSFISEKSQLIPSMNIAENIYLVGKNMDHLGKIFFNKKFIHSETTSLLHRLNISHITSHTLVNELTNSQKQLIEILKSICQNSKLLFIDNIFKYYNKHELNLLWTTIEYLRELGCSIVFFTNVYIPLLDHINRTLIIKSNTTAMCINTEHLSKNFIVSILSENTHLDFDLSLKRTHHSTQSILSLKNFSFPSTDCSIDIQLKSGEVTTLFDYTWENMLNFTHSLCGFIPHSGNVFIDHQQINYQTASEAFHHGIGLVDESTKQNNVFYNLSLIENITLMSPKQVLLKNGLINKRVEKYLFKNALKQSGSHNLLAQSHLSIPSFNKYEEMQICVARLLCAHIRIIVFINPQLCFDDITATHFKQLLDYLCNLNICVLLVTSNLENLLNLSDRIVLFNRNHFFKEIK